MEVPGQGAARVGQGPVVEHLGGLATREVLSPAADRLGRREVQVQTGGGSSVVRPAGVHLLQPPERHDAGGSLEVFTGRLGPDAALCVCVSAWRRTAVTLWRFLLTRLRGGGAVVVSDTMEARVRSSSRGAFTCRVKPQEFTVSGKKSRSDEGGFFVLFCFLICFGLVFRGKPEQFAFCFFVLNQR